MSEITASAIMQDRQVSLSREQKKAIGLLSVGTFLEFFDLMLFIHMAVLLDELFFPKTDPHIASMISATAFCSTYLLRPFGALIFGYLGDNIGRKATVIITTFMMSASCLVMANLPTYAQIGVTATWIVIICRITQGLSSMGEIVGAELYLTETTKPPLRYPVVASLSVLATAGVTAALALASLVISFGLNWRIAFWIGALVAIIGTVARTTLRETPDFADAKRRIHKIFIDSNRDPKILKKNVFLQEKVNKKTAFSLFLIQCLWPACFYFGYIHCGNILKNEFGFSAEQVINQNLIVSIGDLIVSLVLAYLSYKVYPLMILKVKLVMFSCLVLVCPYLLYNISAPFELLLLQLMIVTFVPTDFPAASIWYVHFPVFKRFTTVSLMYALARALMAVVTSFGIVYLVESLGNWGILVMMVPLILGYGFALFHFQGLERSSSQDPQRAVPARLVEAMSPAN
jgi:MHS family proline/betaine transporter-like MFS transporter